MAAMEAIGAQYRQALHEANTRVGALEARLGAAAAHAAKVRHIAHTTPWDPTGPPLSCLCG